jgi:hypothetical protein
MNQNWKVESWAEEHVNPHLRLPNCLFEIFGSPEWDELARVAFQVAQTPFRAEMGSDLDSDCCFGLVEEHPFVCASSMSGDFSLLHLDK